MNMIIIISVVSVLVVFLLVMGIGSFMRSGADKAERRVKQRLRALALTHADELSIDLLLREGGLSGVPLFDRLLDKLKWASKMDKLIYQADAKGSAGVYLLACALLAVIGLYGGSFSDRIWVSALTGGFMGYLPVFVLRAKKRKRQEKFQQQLPEALDLMARALKAGHTFGGGMRMVADEFEPPIGPEFGKTLDEINYGMDVDRALSGLQDRVDCTDLKFFVVSINIQRETGGNLAEIIAKIASLVRERFALYGKIRVLSAEGRVSAYILIALPFLITGILYVVNAKYISLLWTRELGVTMVYASLISIVIGSLVIRKIIKIKV